MKVLLDPVYFLTLQISDLYGELEKDQMQFPWINRGIHPPPQCP